MWIVYVHILIRLLMGVQIIATVDIKLDPNLTHPASNSSYACGEG